MQDHIKTMLKEIAEAMMKATVAAAPEKDKQIVEARLECLMLYAEIDERLKKIVFPFGRQSKSVEPTADDFAVIEKEQHSGYPWEEARGLLANTKNKLSAFIASLKDENIIDE